MRIAGKACGVMICVVAALGKVMDVVIILKIDVVIVFLTLTTFIAVIGFFLPCFFLEVAA